MTTDERTPAPWWRHGTLLVGQAVAMVLLGLLVTYAAADGRPLAAEDGIVRALAAHRGPLADTVTAWLSTAASTEMVIGLALLCVVALLVAPRVPLRAEALFLGASVAAQSAVFLLVTAFVERPRPDVERLDGAPPTSSFPSGHVGASAALYGGLAVLALRRLRGPWRLIAATLLFLVPPAVALSRMYRGMHHPSDVVGGLLNATSTLLVMGSAFLTERAPASDTRPGTRAVPGLTTGFRALVVRHPLSCPDDLAGQIRTLLDRHGCAEQQWTSTSAERPCGELAGRTGLDGVDLVVVCGGDGTVQACADVLSGTGVPLALAPCGTGNLLARNLGLPTDTLTALEEALEGADFGIDVGRLTGDGLTPARFTVMVGAGFDAAMVRDASPALKARLGWPAYALSAARHLGDPRMRLTLRLDGGRPLRRSARMVAIGNVGTLQGGLELLPGARPDSGRLEVVLLDPHGPAGWLSALTHLAARALPWRTTDPDPASGDAGPVAGGALEYFTASRVDLRFDRPQAREADGEVLSDGTRLSVAVEPSALRVRLPRSPASVVADAVPAVTGGAPSPLTSPSLPTVGKAEGSRRPSAVET
ncbi:diacylglycerol kinase family protein [Streptomyces sp. NPDC001941]|uniref:diacylglycerol kinase family protein n=1 Tax=Streptomyces sp. NPDC001941 TaxID=3154659 RepID=UPI00332C81A5